MFRLREEHGQMRVFASIESLTPYFIYKHVFLHPDLAADDFGMLSLSFDTSQSDCEQQDMLDEAQNLQSPEKLQKGRVLAFRAICQGCNEFIKKVNMAIGLMIDFGESSSILEVMRYNSPSQAGNLVAQSEINCCTTDIFILSH
jgi:hypothetical protein